MNAVVIVITVMKFKSLINDNIWSFIVVLNRFIVTLFYLSAWIVYLTNEILEISGVT